MNRPGRQAGNRIKFVMSAEGATQVIMQIGFSAAPIGAHLISPSNPGLRPGAIFCPSGLDLSVTRFATETSLQPQQEHGYNIP